MITPSRRNQSGFTLIELMIATVVLSVLLLIVAAVLTGIGSIYYKGANAARTQQNVRAITDDIGQQIQYGNSFTPVIPVAVNGITEAVMCSGSVRYTFVVGKQLGTDTAHALWRDQNPTPGGCPTTASATPDLASGSLTGGTELVAPRSRLTALTVDDSQAPYYRVSVGTAYGDSDLLKGSALLTHCAGGIGDQYCSTASLETTVLRRLP